MGWHRQFWEEPQAKADFIYWAKVPDWSLEEIVALSLGKDPRFVSSDKFVHGTRGTTFSAAYFGLLDLAERARDAGILMDRTPATQAVKWADAAGFPFPKDVVESIRRFARQTRRKPPVAVPPVEYKPPDPELATELNSLTELHETPATQINTEPAMQEEPVQDPELVDPGIDKSVGMRERDSFLKLFVGLAALHYEYDPSRNRNSSADQISKALKNIGIKLGDDTIRRLLDEGNEFITAEAIRAIKAAKAEKA